MEKLSVLFTFLLLMAFQQMDAQIAKGNLLVGGTAGFSIDFEDNSDNAFNAVINPMVAKFVTNNLAVGGNLGFSLFKVGEYSASAISLLPIARYYFDNNDASPVFFVEGKVGLILVRESFDGNSDSEFAVQYSVGPGMAFFITENVSIDAILAYNRIGGDFDQSNLALNIGLQVFLGGKDE